MSDLRKPVVALVALVAAMPAAAWAQQGDADALLALDKNSLRTEIQQRYDAALAVSTDPTVISADDNRYMWASEAKVQCGIALGFLKSNTRDEVSLSKCGLAYDMMNRQPAPYVAPQQPQQPQAVVPQACDAEAPGLIFFEFDSAVPQQDAIETVQYVVDNAAVCNWRSFNIVGHADRAGSNAYNIGLSEDRAEAISNLMTSRGIDAARITTQAKGEESPRVPTADGVRELQNRRVEILVGQ